MKIKQITRKSDQLLFFGGVYSNFQALKSLKEITEDKGFAPSQIICNGDVVGYCSQPEECVQLIKDWGIHCIVGNVEEQLRNGEEDCGCDFEEDSRCDIFSRQWYPYAKSKISANSLSWLKELPDFVAFKVGGKKGMVVHGSFSQISTFVFASTPWGEKQKEFDACEADIIVAGHSGIPFSESKDGKIWVNPGVIGMPANNGSTAVWYAILSLAEEEYTIEHCPFEYNNKLANQLMIQNGLPTQYAETLLTGIWDNCEILPEAETKQQGKTLGFNNMVNRHSFGKSGS